MLGVFHPRCALSVVLLEQGGNGTEAEGGEGEEGAEDSIYGFGPGLIPVLAVK